MLLFTQPENSHIDKSDQDPFIYIKNTIVFLSIKIHSINIIDFDQFVSLIPFNVAEPETYTKAMQGYNTIKWAKGMEEELDQLRKNNT